MKNKKVFALLVAAFAISPLLAHGDRYKDCWIDEDGYKHCGPVTGVVGGAGYAAGEVVEGTGEAAGTVVKETAKAPGRILGGIFGGRDPYDD